MHRWYQNYIITIGSQPDETEEPLLWRRSWLHFTRGSSWRTGHRIPIFRFGHHSRGEWAECRSAECTLHEEMALTFSETDQFQAGTLLGKRRGTFSKQHAWCWTFVRLHHWRHTPSRWRNWRRSGHAAGGDIPRSWFWPCWPTWKDPQEIHYIESAQNRQVPRINGTPSVVLRVCAFGHGLRILGRKSSSPCRSMDGIRR